MERQSDGSREVDQNLLSDGCDVRLFTPFTLIECVPCPEGTQSRIRTTQSNLEPVTIDNNFEEFIRSTDTISCRRSYKI